MSLTHARGGGAGDVADDVVVAFGLSLEAVPSGPFDGLLTGVEEAASAEAGLEAEAEAEAELEAKAEAEAEVGVGCAAEAGVAFGCGGGTTPWNTVSTCGTSRWLPLWPSRSSR